MMLARRLAALLLFVAPALAAQSPKTIPVRDFFRNPAKAYFQVSQGGKYVSHTEPYQNRMNIMVRPVAGGEAKRITATTESSSSRIPGATRTSTCTWSTAPARSSAI